MSAYAEIALVVAFPPCQGAAYNIAEIAVVDIQHILESHVEIAPVYEQRYPLVEHSAQLDILYLLYINIIHNILY